MSKLSTATPAQALVDAYLREIALAYGVPWLSADAPADTGAYNNTAQEVKVRSNPKGTLSFRTLLTILSG
jgi:hypothetical protein